MKDEACESVCRAIRRLVLQASTRAGSGHPTSSLSAVELTTILFTKFFRFDPKNPDLHTNDRFILSKGHASPLYYSMFVAVGLVSEKDFIRTYRAFDSKFEGHPTPAFPFTEVATGSLGQGLAIGAGQAFAIQRYYRGESRLHTEEIHEVVSDATPRTMRMPRVFVLMGDGECSEGSVWEACATASKYALDNLIAIVDVNRLGQSGETLHGHNMEAYRAKFEAFGWAAIVIDGHDYGQIDAAYTKALSHKGSPSVILAQTVKGKGISFLEDKEGYHGRVLTKDELPRALKELSGGPKGDTFRLTPPDLTRKWETDRTKTPSYADPAYPPEEPIATRKAFGNALVRVGTVRKAMVVLDGDVKNSTYTELFADAFPDRFFQMYIAEQTMVGVAVGLEKRGFEPWVSTFACFLSRAFDQIRMAGLSGATIRFNGSHGGVSVGADGGSQMGLEDIAMFRSVLGSAVLYPADPYATERLVEEMMKVSGISYIRTTRPATEVLYDKETKFFIGGSVIHPAKREERLTVVGAGITLHEALKAQKDLEKQGIGIRVIDCYSIKPIDDMALEDAVKETDGILVVEDHYAQGGIGDAVASVLVGLKIKKPMYHLAVDKVPRSGPPEKLLDFQGISAKRIVEKVRSVLG